MPGKTGIFAFLLALCLGAPYVARAADSPDSSAVRLPLSDLLSELVPADEISGGPARRVQIQDSLAWLSKRESILRRAALLLGAGPEISGPLDIHLGQPVQREGFSEQEFDINSGSGDRVTGYLLVPDGASARSPRPAIMALHGTIEGGAAVTVGRLRSRENRYYGEELARRGYVVLAPDVITSGKRVSPGREEFDTGEFDSQFPQWSAMGKMLSDHMRCVDCLCTLEYVDSTRIGVIGHSLGGYNAFFLQGFDRRVRAGVSSCGFVTIGDSDYPFRFARDRWFVHFPRLRDFVRAGVAPLDMHEVLALCAPRPFFNYSARQDHIFPDFQAIEPPLAQVASLYVLLGAPERFEREWGEGDHDFPPAVREKAYRFLDSWLKRK